MASTYQDIVDAGLLRSRSNRPEWAANNQELLNVAGRTLGLAYQLGHLLSPDRWTFSTDWLGGGVGTGEWPFVTPPLVYIENITLGGEVKVVSVHERTVDVGAGRIYWKSVSNLTSVALTGDPGSNDLLRFWSLAWAEPTPPAAGVLSAPWVEHFNGLLIDEVALYLAIKEGRDSEVQMFTTSRNQWLQQYISFLRMATSARASRFAPRTVNSGEIQALAAAFLGEAQVA